MAQSHPNLLYVYHVQLTRFHFYEVRKLSLIDATWASIGVSLLGMGSFKLHSCDPAWVERLALP